MSRIDFDQMITADAKAADTKARRAHGIKAECSARILSVLDRNTVANIQGAALVGDLTPAQMTAFRSAQDWIAQMQAICRAAIAGDHAPQWPDPPASVIALATRF